MLTVNIPDLGAFEVKLEDYLFDESPVAPEKRTIKFRSVNPITYQGTTYGTLVVFVPNYPPENVAVQPNHYRAYFAAIPEGLDMPARQWLENDQWRNFQSPPIRTWFEHLGYALLPALVAQEKQKG